MKKVTAILKGSLFQLLFFIIATLLAGVLTYVLLVNNYEPDPVIQVAVTFVGVWLLLSGFYFREKRIRWGALLLLGFSFVGLVIKGL